MEHTETSAHSPFRALPIEVTGRIRLYRLPDSPCCLCMSRPLQADPQHFRCRTELTPFSPEDGSPWNRTEGTAPVWRPVTLSHMFGIPPGWDMCVTPDGGLLQASDEFGGALHKTTVATTGANGQQELFS